MTQRIEQSYEAFCFALQLQVRNVGNFGFSGGLKNYTSWLSERKALWSDVSELNFAKRQICQLPSQIGLFYNVTVLSLHGCGLEELPEEITNLTVLKELYLGCNQLDCKKLEPILDRFCSLEIIHLTENDTALIQLLQDKFPRIQIKIQGSSWYANLFEKALRLSIK